MRQIDLLIIGTGPAGLSAALYSSRAGMDVLISEKSAPGGRLINTHIVENYVGTGSVTGLELAMKNIEQATSFGAEIVYSGVKKIEKTGKVFHAFFYNGMQVQSKTIFIATGTSTKPIPVQGFDEFFNKGVSGCIVCDGSFHRGKEVAIVGGGNSAIEEGLYATEIVKKLHIINIGPKLTAEKISIDKIMKKKNVVVYNNAITKSINGSDRVESITFNKDGKEVTIEVSGVFAYIGQVANTNFIKDLGITDERGFIKADPQKMTTSIPGLFAGGDVIVKKHRQIATAVGDGTNAALEIKAYIDLL